MRLYALVWYVVSPNKALCSSYVFWLGDEERINFAQFCSHLSGQAADVGNRRACPYIHKFECRNFAVAALCCPRFRGKSFMIYGFIGRS